MEIVQKIYSQSDNGDYILKITVDNEERYGWFEIENIDEGGTMQVTIKKEDIIKIAESIINTYEK